MALESAIPPHLQKDRIIAANTPPDFEPPFPAYTARFPTTTKDLAVAYLGVQDRSGHKEPAHRATAQTLHSFIESCPASLAPAHHDLAAVTDQTGAYNHVIIAYFLTAQAYHTWAEQSGYEAWFSALAPTTELGHFREVFLPTIDRFETVFSDSVVPEGAAHMRAHMSGMMREHVYFGSMRDRLPASQVDELLGRAWKPEADSFSETVGKRVKVPGRENLAIIRSGQDWSNTLPEERKLYLETMHPVLVKGMEFLRDEGREVGCFSCRFMDVLPSKTSPVQGEEGGTEKTFGLAFFDDLASIEGWSKKHKTHLDIFGGFLQYAKKLDNQISLRLFHEVTVLQPDQQIWEYVNCHGLSGMLAGR